MMNEPVVSDVLNYLSIKFNKIFCDREFVCCVIQDLTPILNNKNRRCVLVFPTLGPIYLKALRYQAKIFDLSVFNITSLSGKFKSIALCHKDLIKKIEPSEDAMSESSLLKKKRPERQLYIPPAQRKSRLTKKCKSATESDGVNCFSLSDVVDVFCSFNLFPCEYSLTPSFCHRNCDFKKYLLFKSSSNFNAPILIYNNFFIDFPWKTDKFYYKPGNGASMCYPIIDLTVPETSEVKPTAILVNNINFNNKTYEVEDEYFKITCDNNCDENIIDLSELGHYFIISHEGSDYLFECQGQHEPDICRESKKKELQRKTENQRQASICKKCDKIEIKKKNIDDKNNNENIKKNEHEEEKEIMRKTKKNINRKTRPIMKYVDDVNDTLEIDKDDSVNNWEDLFNDDGEIEEELLTEIIDKVGDDIVVVKASEDYSLYTNKSLENLEHVVELYNFPASLETRDLVQAFSEINSDAMYVKWVDDTHALLILGSESQAQKAVSMGNSLIKVRPLTAASAASVEVACKSDLKPAMKRPPTNLQTARRLITTHLGAKSKVTKEQMAKEKQDLRTAKEMKRLHKQNERDAWEGSIRSSVN